MKTLLIFVDILYTKCIRFLLTATFRRFFFGCIHNSLFGVYKSFLEAKETFYINKLYHKADSFDEISSITKHTVKPMGLVLIERQIRSDLEYRNGESVIRLVQEWFEESLREGHDLEDIQMDLLNLYSSIKYVIFDMYTLHGTRIKNGWEAYEIFKIQTVDELREWFFDWINYTLNCLNTVLQEFVNTGLLILRKPGSWFIRLSPTIPQNILSPKLSKPGSMMIWRLISVQ